MGVAVGAYDRPHFFCIPPSISIPPHTISITCHINSTSGSAIKTAAGQLKPQPENSNRGASIKTAAGEFEPRRSDLKTWPGNSNRGAAIKTAAQQLKPRPENSNCGAAI